MTCSTNELDNSSLFQGDEVDEYNVSSQTNVKIVKVVPLPHARSEVWSYFGFIADDDGEIHDKKKTICRICATTLCYSGNTTNLFTHLKAMHPEVNPQKLAPTNKVPRTGKKSNKRRFADETESSLIPIEIDSSNYIRNVSFTSNTPVTESKSQHSMVPTPVSSNVTHSSTTVISMNSGHADLLKSPTSKQANSGAASTFGLINQDHNSTANQAHNGAHTDEVITDAIVNLIVRDCRPIDLVTGRHFEGLIKLLAPTYKIPQADRLEQLVKKKYIEVRREMILRSMEE